MHGNYKVVHAFCADLSLCPRGHAIVKDDKWHRVFCFARKEDVEKFQARFGGEVVRSGAARTRARLASDEEAEAEILLTDAWAVSVSENYISRSTLSFGNAFRTRASKSLRAKDSLSTRL